MKIGVGTWDAWIRQGFRELRAAFYPESNIAQASEYGMWGTKTQGEVASDRENDERTMNEESSNRSVVEERMNRSNGRDDPGDDMEIDMDI